jgi:hypothetical protein
MHIFIKLFYSKEVYLISTVVDYPASRQRITFLI